MNHTMTETDLFQKARKHEQTSQATRINTHPIDLLPRITYELFAGAVDICGE
jgi:hypothetical protein